MSAMESLVIQRLQPCLPFPNWFVPPRHVHWLTLANAGNYAEKSTFYAFKTRFLKAHAIPDGYDLQVIVKKCYCGDGIYRGCDDLPELPATHWERCWKCNGTGVYDRAYIVLTRWDLNGQVFHIPEGRKLNPTQGHRELIHGLVRHEPEIHPRVAARAMRRLLLRYEPRTLWHVETERLKALGRRASWPLRRVWQRMKEDAGTRWPECNYSDEIPF